MDSDIEMLNDVMFMVESVYKAYLLLPKTKKEPMTKRKKRKKEPYFHKEILDIKRQPQLNFSTGDPLTRKVSVDQHDVMDSMPNHIAEDNNKNQTLGTAPNKIVKLHNGTAPKDIVHSTPKHANEMKTAKKKNLITEKKCNKKIWVRDLFLDRDNSGFFAMAFKNMKTQEPAEFRRQTRTSPEIFDMLFKRLENRLVKNSMRAPIPAECRLFLTLIYLAQGPSRQQLSVKFKMSVNAVRTIILDTCEIIWEHLKEEYFAAPSVESWEKIAVDFNSLLNLPNCVGAIDGKLIDMKCRRGSSSKKDHCIVLLGACDTNYRFTVIDIGVPGDRVHTFSEFGKRLKSDAYVLDLPADAPLPNSDESFPHYFVSNLNFPLKSFIMRPYAAQRTLNHKQELFNNYLAKAQNLNENTFGVLTARWQILHGTLQMSSETYKTIICATVMLHNFLKTEDITYCPPEYVDRVDENDLVVPGLWRREFPPLKRMSQFASNNAAKSDMELRNVLQEHLFFQKTYYNIVS